MAESDRNEDEQRGAAGRDVISSLPRHRPHRRSAKRGASRPADAAAAAAEKGEAGAAQKPRAAAKPKAAKKPAAKKPAAATKAAGAKAKPTPRPPRERIGATAGAKTRDASERAASSLRSSPDKPAGPPSGTELIGTAVQAAGELAQIGLKLGSQAVKKAVGRLPKP